jgi:RNA polymerase sigma-70 factor (ECF subfamily)
VFNLFVIEDYSHKEIAEMLGISEGTSKSNLSKAKKNLKQILTEEFSNLRE